MKRFFQSSREASRLWLRISEDPFRGLSPLVKSPCDHLDRACRELYGLDEFVIRGHEVEERLPEPVQVTVQAVLVVRAETAHEYVE